MNDRSLLGSTPSPLRDGPVSLGSYLRQRYQLALERWANDVQRGILAAAQEQAALEAEMREAFAVNLWPMGSGEDGGAFAGAAPIIPSHELSREFVPMSRMDLIELRDQLSLRRLANRYRRQFLETSDEQIATAVLLADSENAGLPADDTWLNATHPDIERCLDDTMIERLALTAIVHFSRKPNRGAGASWDEWVAEIGRRLPSHSAGKVIALTSQYRKILAGDADAEATHTAL